MAASDLLIVASGTATLEAGIYGTPMIVTYSAESRHGLLVRPAGLAEHELWALVNIVAGKEIVPEMYQWRAEAAAPGARGDLDDPRRPPAGDPQGPRRGPPQARLPGASRRAAEEVLKTIGRLKAIGSLERYFPPGSAARSSRTRRASLGRQ
jgi:lipid-A-disaccharide synthase